MEELCRTLDHQLTDIKISTTLESSSNQMCERACL